MEFDLEARERGPFKQKQRQERSCIGLMYPTEGEAMRVKEMCEVRELYPQTSPHATPEQRQTVPQQSFGWSRAAKV